MRQELSIINNLEDKIRDLSQEDDNSSMKDSETVLEGSENEA
jgi:hypothetical protein